MKETVFTTTTIEAKSLRLDLVKVLIDRFFSDYQFEFTNDIEKETQSFLDSYLKFETKVAITADTTEGTVGSVLVINELGVKNTIDFHVVFSGLKFE